MMPQVINVCTRADFSVKSLMRLFRYLLSEAVYISISYCGGYADIAYVTGRMLNRIIS